MEPNKEISALFTLIDDPDEEVYSTISDKIISLGKDIIPNLENLWETTPNEDVQERIELLIHKLHFQDLYTDFKQWKKNEDGLLSATILCAKYHYPELQQSKIYFEVDKLKKNIWLELNNYLTPLEQANVVTSILYNYFKLKGVETAYSQPENFLINKTLENRKGNTLSNGILYLILAELLDLPVHAVNIPRQFLLAYSNDNFTFSQFEKRERNDILFYIDPLNGQIYTHADIDIYFDRLGLEAKDTYFKKKNNIEVIQLLLQELSKCFDNDKNSYKMLELESIITLLENE